MKRIFFFAFAFFSILWVWEGKTTVHATASQEALADSMQDDRDRHVAALLEKLKGKEQEKASTIFPELTIPSLKDMTVERFLRTMNVGYSRGLGVSCNGCHTSGDYADESNEHFGVARQMAQLTEIINAEAKKLPAFANKRGNFTNCFTCHQGQHEPPRDRGARLLQGGPGAPGGQGGQGGQRPPNGGQGGQGGQGRGN